MPELVLTELEQQALRDLLAAEPCPGAPLPSRRVLERLEVLIPADNAGAIYQDGSYWVTQSTRLIDPEEFQAPFCYDGPVYLGVMHWRRDPVAARSCLGRTLEGGLDGIAIGFRNGADAIVQIDFDRYRTPFSERDLAMLRMVTPLLARLVRERPTPSLPLSHTTQERRVISHLAAGLTNTEIAAALFIAPSTVRKHLEHTYRKLGVTGRVAAVARLQGRDLPDLDLRERIARLG
jgi:DNA-binding CsgD family transcriptional regulator